eukprot:g5573.t1
MIIGGMKGPQVATDPEAIQRLALDYTADINNPVDLPNTMSAAAENTTNKEDDGLRRESGVVDYVEARITTFLASLTTGTGDDTTSTGDDATTTGGDVKLRLGGAVVECGSDQRLNGRLHLGRRWGGGRRGGGLHRGGCQLFPSVRGEWTRGFEEVCLCSSVWSQWTWADGEEDDDDEKEDDEEEGKPEETAQGPVHVAGRETGQGPAMPGAQADLEPPTVEEATDPPAEEATDPPVEEATDLPVEEATGGSVEEATAPPVEEATDPPARTPVPLLGAEQGTSGSSFAASEFLATGGLLASGP